MHSRKTIKKKLVELLATPVVIEESTVYPTMARDRVYKDRRKPLTDHTDSAAVLPAVCVYMIDETASAPGEMDWTCTKRTGTVFIDLHVTDSADNGDVVDDFANQIEAVLTGNDTWGGTISWAYLTRTQELYDEQADTDIRSIRMSYTVNYIAVDEIDGGNLDDYLTSDVRGLGHEMGVTMVH